MASIASILPKWLKQPLRRARNALRSASWVKQTRFCPLCGKSANRFDPGGIKPRPNVRCPHCGSLERHRLLWLYLRMRTDFFDGRPRRMLCVAPEPSLDAKFRSILGDDYLSAGLSGSLAMVRMDITKIEFPDESFDVIYCSHVLEHVVDDRKAMREFCRVLKRGGWAILLVPVEPGATYEDPSIVEPQARLKAFGKEDHVRVYGDDYVDRLRETGFRVEVTPPEALVGPADVERYGLRAGRGAIYYCTRADAAAPMVSEA